MALHVAADDGAIEDVEGSEQRDGAVTFVVVGHRTGTARLHRQPWLGAVECLNLALFVDREDDRMGGRIDIEPTMLLSARQERPPARTRVAYGRVIPTWRGQTGRSHGRQSIPRSKFAHA